MSASKWAEWPVLAFDTETTGVNVAEDRIVSAALIELHPGRRPVVSSYVVDPGIDIPAEATAVHGYTRETAAAQATHTTDQMLAEITGRIALWLHRGKPLVGMNVSYDLSILEAENRRHGVDSLHERRGRGNISPVVDVLVLDKYAHQFRKGGRKLVDLCTHYGVTHVGAHDASGDALAAARLWPWIMAKHARKFPGMTLPALHQAQIGWRKAQMDGLRDYFDKQGTVHDGCCGEWPVHEACLRTSVGGRREHGAAGPGRLVRGVCPGCRRRRPLPGWCAMRTRPERIEVYRGAGWRWRWKAANGRIVGASTEGYINRRDCIRNLEKVSGGSVDIAYRMASGYCQGQLVQQHVDTFLVVLP